MLIRPPLIILNPVLFSVRRNDEDPHFQFSSIFFYCALPFLTGKYFPQSCLQDSNPQPWESTPDHRKNNKNNVQSKTRTKGRQGMRAIRIH